jgi:methylenetetrahydrofolate dehydrogenase (NADP+)/methenyltetrahydrofolate cyclohydrolase
MAQIIDGKACALQVRKSLRPRIAVLKERGIEPKLTVVLVGDDPASAVYVRNKEKMCERLGIVSETIRVAADTSQEDVLAIVRKLNEDDSVHGILVQLPLPRHIDEVAVLNEVAANKDVDCFHPINAGKLLRGEKGFLPCTPAGVMRMLEEMNIDIEGKEAVVIGRSNIVGKPLSIMLLQKNATVTICHSRTKNLGEVARRADILVAAIGKHNFVTADMVKPGAVVIDVGVNRIAEKKVAGDVDFDAVEPIASYITPVPGGVGAMTIAMLMENTVFAAEQHVPV